MTVHDVFVRILREREREKNPRAWKYGQMKTKRVRKRLLRSEGRWEVDENPSSLRTWPRICFDFRVHGCANAEEKWCDAHSRRPWEILEKNQGRWGSKGENTRRARGRGGSNVTWCCCSSGAESSDWDAVLSRDVFMAAVELPAKRSPKPIENPGFVKYFLVNLFLILFFFYERLYRDILFRCITKRS